MTRPPFLVTALETGTHDRSRFDCGVPALNRYLREQVSQDIRRRVAACFVALDDSQRIAAYYTLASASVPLTGLPDDLRRKLPRYGSIPAIRMDRLAVDREFKGRGLGSALLVNAMRRAVAAEIPGAVMVVEAKDPQAAAFYRHHGFIDLRDAPLTLFLPLSSLR